MAFQKTEILIVAVVLAFIFTLTYFNLKVSQRRARDFQRKEDVVNITVDLAALKEQSRFYPLSTSDGRIVACKSDPDKAYSPCNWYVDSFFDASDKVSYLPILPGDPETGQGASYFYVSSGSRFQLFAALEGKDEPEYDESIERMGVKCGKRICNFGRASESTPLNRNLADFEEELKAKNKK